MCCTYICPRYKTALLSIPLKNYYTLLPLSLCNLLFKQKNYMHDQTNLNDVIGERERAYLVVQLARIFCLYIYIYPALMYAVIFYVILNKRKRLGDCVKLH